MVFKTWLPAFISPVPACTTTSPSVLQPHPGSVIVFGSVVTLTSIIGYVIAFGGVLWYNYLRMPRQANMMEQAAEAPLDSSQPQQTGELEVESEGQPLLKSHLLEEMSTGARVQRNYTAG